MFKVFQLHHSNVGDVVLFCCCSIYVRGVSTASSYCCSSFLVFVAITYSCCFSCFNLFLQRQGVCVCVCGRGGELGVGCEGELVAGGGARGGDAGGRADFLC